MTASSAHLSTWFISALAVLGVIVRPWNLPEALWAVSGAVALAVCSLISIPDAASAILQGTDVYLFLTGMMLLAELGRREGLFDWLAAHAVLRSRGSASRLFTLVYGVGVIVTVFLSNDATAVVLTPAVAAAARRAEAQPLPYLLICAFIANAASFVLPISNPANLVVYGAHMPPLPAWVRQFAIPSVVSIATTYCLLRLTQRSLLTGKINSRVTPPALSREGRVVAVGVAVTALILLISSARDWQLGLPTLVAGIATAAVILVLRRASPWPVLKHISWSVLPLVAALFVLVRGIENTDVLEPLVRMIAVAAKSSPHATALLSGSIAALGCNVMNNLPLGLVAGAVATGAHLSPPVTGALLIGVDLGPNLSVTGSLATILWLAALRREGQAISGWTFLLVGSIVMPAALLAALASFIWLATVIPP